VPVNKCIGSNGRFTATYLYLEPSGFAARRWVHSFDPFSVVVVVPGLSRSAE
jgi:hypothetical protein